MPDNSIFSDEYPIDRDATEPSEQRTAEVAPEEDMKEQMKMYGTGKPRREVIRGDITHD